MCRGIAWRYGSLVRLVGVGVAEVPPETNGAISSWMIRDRSVPMKLGVSGVQSPITLVAAASAVSVCRGLRGR
jgi:hypothetical protein